MNGNAILSIPIQPIFGPRTSLMIATKVKVPSRLSLGGIAKLHGGSGYASTIGCIRGSSSLAYGSNIAGAIV